MTITLQRCGVDVRGLSPQQIRERFAEHRGKEHSHPDEAVHDGAGLAQRTAEFKRRLDEEKISSLQMTSLRNALSRRGIESAKMSIDEMTISLKQVQAAEKARDDRLRVEREAAQLQARRESLLAAADCPKRHIADLANLDPKNDQWLQIRDLLAERVGHQNGFLVALLGTRGNGKTQLAVSVIEYASRQLYSARYIKILDLFRLLQRAYSPRAKGEGGETEAHLIEPFLQAELLVIDECHQRGGSDWEQSRLINLLDRRYDQMLCTILIANQPKDEFSAAMGDTVVSRIHQTGEAIECDWPSYRKPGSWRQNGNEPRRPAILDEPSLDHE